MNVLSRLLALTSLLLLTNCANTANRGFHLPDLSALGSMGSGGPFDPAQADFIDLPQRIDGISLYGPGSQNVSRNPVAPIYFGFDSYRVAPSEQPKVQQLAQVARGTLIIIAGHTDSSGTLEYNRQLGERRAMAVRKSLLSQGVPPGNVQTISYGEDMRTGRGDSKDRRCEFGALIRR
ncbi:MAG: OmpA family protein [Verrucomicrobiota bacterium]